MNCSEVVKRFTDYLDGSAPEGVVSAIDRHLEMCATCVRYRSVVVNGTAILRSLPEPELREDFQPRLQHRLFHVDDEATLRAHAASGTPAMTVIGIAVLLTAIAWSPMLVPGSPVVELPPIVVDQEPDRSRAVPVAATSPGTFSSKSEAELDMRLWANTLLYDYTPLSQRYQQRARVRRVTQLDR